MFQLFGYSMIFPFLAKEEFRKPIKALCHAVLLILIPLLFYNEYWTTTYIDPFVAILAGCAFARILYWKSDVVLDRLYISFLCATLVLSKDVGLYFAVFIAIAYAISYCIRKEVPMHPTKRGKAAVQVWASLIPLIFTIFAKWTWKLELMNTNAYISFGGKIDIQNYTSMFFLHDNETYHQTVVDNFKNAFFDQKIKMDQLGLEMSYCALFLLIVLGLIVLYCNGKNEGDQKERKVLKITLTIVFLQLVFYIYSLGATYVSNFSEYEATHLASYQRYMNISYLAVAIFLIEGIMFHSSAVYGRGMFQCLAIVLILLISPLGAVENYLSRDSVRAAKEIRDKYEPLHNLIRNHCSGTDSDKIYFISQASNGLDYWITRFISRPNGFAGNWRWSLGEPQYEGDIWTYGECTNSDEWMKILDDGNYTHIALYSINDYFKEHFSGVFSDPSMISNNTLYEKNAETGLFDLCN